MNKTFRPWNVDQVWLLPPSIDDFVPAGHPAQLVRATLDLGEVMAAYDEPRGQPPYHPAMMVAVLLYAYSQGVYSSRRIARALEERLDFMAVSALEVPHVSRIERDLERRPKEVSADFGYCSEANLQALEDRGIKGYLATGRQKHPAGGTAKRRGPLVQAMRQKLERGGRRSRYRLRKQTVEPVFGQIKQARAFRQLLLRGLSKVQSEWALLCTAHNTFKLLKALPA